MAVGKLKWDILEERIYQTGCDHGALYVMENGVYTPPVPWNGLVNVTETPGGDEPTDQYADNMVYFKMRSAPTYGGTIECFYTPKEFDKCDGKLSPVPGMKFSQQRRSPFGFAYRSKKGNATDGDDYGFIIHVVYNATVSPTELAHNTVNDSPEAATLSYEYATTPVDVKGKGPDGKPWKPVASLEFDSTELTEEQMRLVEETLYGKDAVGEVAGTEGRFPLPDEWITLLTPAETE